MQHPEIPKSPADLPAYKKQTKNRIKITLRGVCAGIWLCQIIARDVWVSEAKTIEYRFWRTVEPKQGAEGASVSSDARRLCDASGDVTGFEFAQHEKRRKPLKTLTFSDVTLFKKHRQNVLTTDLTTYGK